MTFNGVMTDIRAICAVAELLVQFACVKISGLPNELSACS